MKIGILLMGCFLAYTPFSALGAIPDNCETLLRQAESSDTTTIQNSAENPYDLCGFNDEKIVWETWAPFASQNNLKRALYEICVRFPEHIYHDTYCEKSAELGYGPALAIKAENLIQKGEIQTGLSWATKAIETNQLSTEQTGKLLEVIGVNYFQNKNPQYQAYLEQAALRRSALANHLLGVLAYEKSENDEQQEQMAFQLIWRAILLDCPNAEENLGLFHLKRQGKIPFDTALRMMQEKMMTCQPTPQDSTASDSDDKEFYSCRCKTAIETEKRYREKPYLLLKTEGEQALLQDESGQEYQVSVKDNLPNQGTVAEIRKSAVILTYPNDRVILNLYKPNKCAEFCTENNITENLTPEEMEKRLMGDVGLIIKPYHLTFTPQECETILYYAPDLVDTNLPFVGKEECAAAVSAESENSILNQILSREESNTKETFNSAQSSDIIESESTDITEETKRRLKQFGADLIE